MTSKEKLISTGKMILKASLGAALYAAATAATGADFGPTGNAIALVVSQLAIHLIDVLGLRATPSTPSGFW